MYELAKAFEQQTLEVLAMAEAEKGDGPGILDSMLPFGNALADENWDDEDEDDVLDSDDEEEGEEDEEEEEDDDDDRPKKE